MTRAEIDALFARRAEAWRRRDPVALAADFAEDAVVVSPMFATVSGRAAITKSYEALFTAFPDWDLRADELVTDGDRAAQAFRVVATHASEFFGLPGSGKRFEIHGVLLFEFAGLMIAREKRVYDFTSLLMQLGVLKARPR